LPDELDMQLEDASLSPACCGRRKKASLAYEAAMLADELDPILRTVSTRKLRFDRQPPRAT
jgi:hypothetical protein